jgi:Glycosyl transferase family 2
MASANANASAAMPPINSHRPSPSKFIEVSVVMPCLNEVRTLAGCIEAARKCLDEYEYAAEIILADNGSTDGSIELAESLGLRVVHAERRGYGAALQAGIAAARGKFVIMGDADGSYDFGHIHRFVEKLREDYDLVMGNRFAGGIEGGAMPPLHRYFGNPLLSALGRRIFGRQAGDFYCGLRGFRKDTFDQLNVRSEGMEFALEMVSKMKMFGMRVTEVPTTLSPDGRDRKPHLRTWQDGWRSLRLYLMLSPRWLFWYPGWIMVVAGLGLGIPLSFGPLEVGGVSFDIHSLAVCAALITLGFQSILFAVLAKATAVRSGLHPPSGLAEQAMRRFTLRNGLRAGGLLVVLGMAGMFFSFGSWANASFGVLDPFLSMRQVIPSLLSIVVGAEFALACLYMTFATFVEQSRPQGSSKQNLN